MGVGHADFAHASSALCLCAFVTLCHKEGLKVNLDFVLKFKNPA